MPLLPICSKVLQHIIFHTMFTYFIKNNQYLKTHQDLSVVILASIDYQPLLKKYFSVLMTITKFEEYYLTFQMLSIKSGTREFIHKFKSKKISRNLLGLFTDFSRKRKQRVFLTTTFHLILGQYQYLCSSRFYIRSTFIPP